MMLIRAPEALVNRLMEISNSQERSLLQYVTEILEQAVRAHEMDRSLKEIVDSYEKTTTEETERSVEELTSEVFEKMLASKLGPKIRAKSKISEEREMLSRFLSQIAKKPS